MEKLRSGLISGTADLRGIPVDGTVTQLSARGVDFSGAVFRGQGFEDCEFVDCTFDYATMASLRFWSSKFVRCSFVHTDMRRCFLATFNPGTPQCEFLSCAFEEADLSGAVSWGGDFVDCSFVKCRLDSAQFDQCSFVRTLFEGELRLVEFDARRLVGDRFRTDFQTDGLDLTRAALRESSLIGFRLAADRVQLPVGDSNLWVISDAVGVLSQALRRLDGRDDIESAAAGRWVRMTLKYLEADRNVPGTVVDYVHDRQSLDSAGLWSALSVACAHQA